MKMLQRAEAKKAVVRYGGLLLGTAILSFGLYNIHSQASITEGGVLGLQLLIQHWFGISPSIIGPVMDRMEDSGRELFKECNCGFSQLCLFLLTP